MVTRCRRDGHGHGTKTLTPLYLTHLSKIYVFLRDPVSKFFLQRFLRFQSAKNGTDRHMSSKLVSYNVKNQILNVFYQFK